MARKAELRKLGVELPHDPIPRDLGDDAGGGDGKRAAVALDQRVVRQRKIPDRQAVDKAVVGRGFQGSDGAAHGEMGGAQDVQGVDFRRLGEGDSPLDIRAGGELLVERPAFGSAQFFRIIETGAGETVRQNDGCGGHRPGQRPPARLVHAGDPFQAAGMEGGFEGQVRHGSQKRLNLSRTVEWFIETVENSWVENTVPSESTTAPMPVWVQESTMFLW